MPRFRDSLKTTVALVALGSLAACEVGPTYHRPESFTFSAYKEGQGWAPAHPSDAADRKDWWTVFNDPELNTLEQAIEVSNQNLKAAEAAYRQAHALVAEARAELFPTISFTGSAGLTGGGSAANANNSGAATGRSGGTTQSYQLGLGASWEPDIWGAIRRTIEQAKANAQASDADLANARLSAQTELASDYITLRQLDAEKRLLDATVDADARALTVTENKYKAGTAAKSDVLTAQTTLDSVKGSDVDLARQRATFEHAIAILTGRPPAELTITPGPWTLQPLEIPATMPSTLLERRPDVAAAERLAAAASANIGIQTAAYFPTVSLSAAGQTAGAQIGQLFSAPTTFWTLGADVAETIFDAGARRARVAAARAAYDEAVATYRQTTLTAFGQVEDNLAAQRVLIAEQGYVQAASREAQQNVTITENEYKAGTIDYTTVAAAQASSLNEQNSELQLEATRLNTTVSLIAALGGGWTTGDLKKS